MSEEKQAKAEEKKSLDKSTDKKTKQKQDQKDQSQKKEEKQDWRQEILPKIKPGMTIRIYQKIKELNIKGEEKERIQFFEGIVIARKHGSETGATLTVRKTSNGIGVEKIFPINLPTITKIEIKKQARVRRAKLYFLKRGYKKRLREVKFNS